MTETNPYLDRLSGAYSSAQDRINILEHHTAMVLVSYARFMAAFESTVTAEKTDEEMIETAKQANIYLLDLYERLVPIYADLDALVNKIKPREEEGD